MVVEARLRWRYGVRMELSVAAANSRAMALDHWTIGQLLDNWTIGRIDGVVVERLERLAGTDVDGAWGRRARCAYGGPRTSSVVPTTQQVSTTT